MNPNKRYFQKPVGPCTYDTTRERWYYEHPIGIFRKLEGGGEEQIGEYKRNYSDEGPFCPFTQGGKDYALYSPQYTVTRVLSLPDCKDIAGEVDETGVGYCPFEFCVPRTPEDHYTFKYRGVPYQDLVDGQFGFVVGCYWGAEHYNPIYYLDLSRISQGDFTRDSRIGDLLIHRGTTLEEAIDVWDYTKERPLVKIAQEVTCDLQERYDWDPVVEAQKVTKELQDLGSTLSPDATDILRKRIAKYLRWP
jgi:hypothetical protein